VGENLPAHRPHPSPALFGRSIRRRLDRILGALKVMRLARYAWRRPAAAPVNSLSTSAPPRDMMSRAGNVDNLKAIFRDTNAGSEAVIKGAALEGKVDEVAKNAAVLVPGRWQLMSNGVAKLLGAVTILLAMGNSWRSRASAVGCTGTGWSCAASR
jgi:hypothetical protein